jgi:hypothetical protein
MVVSDCSTFTEAENGALGVGVNVGVSVGGISEKEVGDGCSVIVGNRVGVSVTLITVAVQVGSSWIAVIVAVGGAKGSTRFGGNKFRGEPGLMNIKIKYTPAHNVTSKIRILSMSHSSRRAFGFGRGVSV